VIRVLAATPEGTEFSISVGEKFMVYGRQGYAFYAAKRILQFLDEAVKKIVETKPHYQPVLDKLQVVIKGIDECLEEVDKADKINKLHEGVTEGTG
jgi:hypothetical protein